MTVFDRLREARTGEGVLPSGMSFKAVLPDIAECMIAGGVPLGAVEKLERLAGAPNGDTPEAAGAAEMAMMYRVNLELVRRTLVELDGEPVSPTSEDVKLLDEGDRAYLLGLAMRTEPLPGKVEAS